MAERWYVASGELPRKEKTDMPLKVVRVVCTRGNRGHADVAKKLGNDFVGITNVRTSRLNAKSAKEFDVVGIHQNWTTIRNLVTGPQQERQ